MGGSGRVGSGSSGLEFYDPNPTRHAIKIFFVIQPNPLSPKNRLNPTGWVGLNRVGFGGLVDWLPTPICWADFAPSYPLFREQVGRREQEVWDGEVCFFLPKKYKN